jgi:ABC-type multidrug transport system permease subunit
MSAVRNFGILYLRNIRQIPRIPVVLVFGIVMPVIQLSLFGNIFSALGDSPQFQQAYPGVKYLSYIAPSIIMLTTFLGMANASAALLVDVRTGYFDKLRTTPAKPGAVIVARLLAEMTRVTAQALIILFLALALGAEVQSGILGGVVMVLMSVTFSACTVGLLVTALSLKTKSDQATQSAFPLFFILIFLSSAYIPKDQIKNDVIRHIIDFNPVDYLIQAVRELMVGVNNGGVMEASWPWDRIGIVLGASAVAATLFGLLNYRVYRRSIEGK